MNNQLGRIIFITACLVLSLGRPLGAEWSERAVTLVSSLPPTLPWSDQANPQALIMETLANSLSRELGEPVTLVSRPQGRGVLAGNMVAASKPDGYLVAALGPDPGVTRVIQGFTPYTWAEITPLATVWRTFPAIVVRADFPADDLRSLAMMRPAPRLAHTGLEPLDSNTYLALSAARAAGFTWQTVKWDQIDPALLLNDQADAIVLPLGWLDSHPQADRFKVLTILTYDTDPPCGRGRPTLVSQGLNEVAEEPPMTFYLRAKTAGGTCGQLLSAIKAALNDPGLAQSLFDACLKPGGLDLDNSVVIMNNAYENFAAGWAALVPPQDDGR